MKTPAPIRRKATFRAYVAPRLARVTTSARRNLHSYVREMAWREENRREPNGMLYALVASAALAHPVSREWKGYWQRHLVV